MAHVVRIIQLSVITNVASDARSRVFTSQSKLTTRGQGQAAKRKELPLTGSQAQGTAARPRPRAPSGSLLRNEGFPI